MIAAPGLEFWKQTAQKWERQAREAQARITELEEELRQARGEPRPSDQIAEASLKENPNVPK